MASRTKEQWPRIPEFPLRNRKNLTGKDFVLWRFQDSWVLTPRDLVAADHMAERVAKLSGWTQFSLPKEFKKFRMPAWGDGGIATYKTIRGRMPVINYCRSGVDLQSILNQLADAEICLANLDVITLDQASMKITFEITKSGGQ